MNTLDHLNGTRQRLRVAVEVLATHQGPLQRRLGYAAVEMVELRPSDFIYEPLRRRFLELREVFALHRPYLYRCGGQRGVANAQHG